MIIDGNEDRARTLGPFDLIIVGSGVAGQTLARHVLAAHRRILVVESGGRAADAATDGLKTVETPRYAIKPASRERFLGGSANTWGGGCVRLDPIDFTARPWVPHSGWPLSADDLEPYYQKAFDDLGVVPRYRDLPAGQGLAAVADGLRARFLLHAESLYGFEQDLYHTLEQADDSHLLLNANVVAVELNQDETEVERVRIRTLEGADFTVAAAIVVLASGGVENSRLLLMSPTSDGRGVGNANDLVGRFFMEHPKNVTGWIRPATHHPDLDRLVPGLTSSSQRGGFSLSDEAQARHQVLNSHVRFVVEWRWSTNPGVRALKALLGARSAADNGTRGKEPDSVEEVAAIAAPSRQTTLGRLALVIANLPTILLFVGQLLLNRYGPRSRRGRRPIERIWLNSLTDMQPLPTNRVTLSDQLDALGRPRAVVDYEPSELDKRSLTVLHQTLAEALPADVGVVESPLLGGPDEWPIVVDASHHMGGTRMGHDPAESVVDPQGRVHGIGNLYVSGSSVFPSGGYANPTLTVVALAIRLAEHLFPVVL